MPIHYLISKNLYGGDAIGRVVLLQLRQQLPPKLPFRNSHLSVYPMGSLSLLHCRRGLLVISRLTSHKKREGGRYCLTNFILCSIGLKVVSTCLYHSPPPKLFMMELVYPLRDSNPCCSLAAAPTALPTELSGYM